MDGFFADRSALRQVMRERAVRLAGPRALLMQAAHPLAVAGLLAHSDALEDPYERLARTARVMDTIYFGSDAEARRVTRRVRAMHRRVSGRIAEATGPYPGGTPYSADQPDLLLWVLYTLFDSTLVVHELYVRKLERAVQAALWSDFKRVGRLFGLASGDMPKTLADVRDYGEWMLAGDRLVVSRWARRRAREIVLEPPVPLVVRPLLETVNFITVALLPDEIRRQYGFSPLPPPFVRRALVGGGAEYVKRAVVPVLPSRLRYVGAPSRAA